MAFCQALQSVFDPLKISTEEMKFHPACDSSDYPHSVFIGSHGWKSVNFVCNPVEEHISPPTAICTKQRLVTNINLDMCTEILGCETGAMCSSNEFEITTVKKKKKNPPSLSTVEVRKQRGAPPPLTTLSREGRLSLWRKREEGRLMLFPFKPSVLEAERSGGRLLLRVFRPREGMKKAGEREPEKEDKEGAEETGCFVYGSEEKKNKKAVMCKVQEAIFNRDACWVASS